MRTVLAVLLFPALSFASSPKQSKPQAAPKAAVAPASRNAKVSHAAKSEPTPPSQRDLASRLLSPFDTMK